MPVRSVARVVRSPASSPTAPRISAQMKAKQCQKLAEIKTVLVFCGFKALNEQANVLNLSRSSAWKLLKSDHKQSGLSASSINRMLASPDLPPDVRKVIDEYVQEKLRGAYGHTAVALKRFRSKLRYAVLVRQTILPAYGIETAPRES